MPPLRTPFIICKWVCLRSSLAYEMLDEYLLRRSGSRGGKIHGASSTYLMRYAEHITGPQQCSHHRVLRMGVNATPSVSKIEGIPEQRSTSRLLQIQFRSAQKDPICMRRRGRLWERQHENMCRLDAFFLYPGWRDINLVTLTGHLNQFLDWRLR